MLLAADGGAAASEMVRLTAAGDLRCPRIPAPVRPTAVSSDWREHWSAEFSEEPVDGEARFRLGPYDQSVATGAVRMVSSGDGGVSVRVRIVPLRSREFAFVGLSMSLPVDDVAGRNWRFGQVQRTFPVEFDRTFAGTNRDGTLTVGSLVLSFGSNVALHWQDDRQWGIDAFTVRFGLENRHEVFPADVPVDFAFQISNADERALTFERPVPMTIARGEKWIPLSGRKEIVAGSALDFSTLQKVPGRLMGVNLCFSANFPDAEMARKVMTRLSRLGYNAIRLHHHDRDWRTNQKSFDDLVAEAVAQGFRLTTDLYVSRAVPWRAIGRDRPGIVPYQAYKTLIAIDERAFADWCAFARDFLTHRNPRTGRTLAEEPALAYLCTVNEGSLHMGWGDLRTLPEFISLWRERFGEDPPPAVGRQPTHGRALDLLADLERKTFARMRKFLRDDLHVAAPLSAQNCGPHGEMMRGVREGLYDYVDSHFYVSHPRFLARGWQLPVSVENGNPIDLGLRAFAECAVPRVRGKPFVVTEWNFSGPNDHRSAAGLLTGVRAARDRWDGLWRFAYAHDSTALADGGGLPRYFDLAGDPLMQATDRAVAALYLRGDADGGADVQVLGADRRTLKVVTERTCGVFTMGEALRAGPLGVVPGGDSASVWVTSLDGRPVVESERLLLVHLTDVQGEGARYADSSRTVLLEWGARPLARSARARIALAVERASDCEVWAIDSDGSRLAPVPVSVRNGRLTFVADMGRTDSAWFHYEIFRKKKGQ